jgi:hypothetical protein
MVGILFYSRLQYYSEEQEHQKNANSTAGKLYPHIVAFISNQSTELESKISNISKPLRLSGLQSIVNNLNELLIEDNKENNKLNQTFNSRSIIFPSVINSCNLSVTYLNASENQLLRALNTIIVKPNPGRLGIRIKHIDLNLVLDNTHNINQARSALR